ncbi:MAG: 4-(cytidine 5'-diphospho)-2-C-methyl-D-erythritol kinase [Pseudomonadota bacterium]|nr:4-(cytidine 5'-diphospho)-2-C-methyl-D-erythritol kinase [Pseudomonadota bacterium]
MIAISSLAKINLYLHVIGKRDDGLHIIDSLTTFAGVGDTISIEDCKSLSLHVDGPFANELGPIGENLVIKATRLLSKTMGISSKVRFRLTKNLPVSAGLGGGSSNAAAALQLLCRFWETIPPSAELFELAECIGSDVPVCLLGQTSYMGGAGEKLTPAAPLPPGWLVLANPRVQVSTGEIFNRFSLSASEPTRFINHPRDIFELADFLRKQSNDLTEAAISYSPVIKTVIQILDSLDGSLLSRLCGSGSTCFALFSNQSEAQKAVSRLKLSRPNWWICASPIVNNWPEIGSRIHN